MAKVQPIPDYPEDCAKAEGATEIHKMPDGWEIHSETWEPEGEAKAVLLHGHGWMESTQTLGMRRVAKQCLSRNLILIGYDQHGHGLSLSKGGKRMSERRRGCIDSLAAMADHMVELAQFAVDKYKLPLIIMGHSLGANACCMATRRIVEACKQANVPFVCALYVAVPVSVTPKCCGESGIKCCCACCCFCSLACGCCIPKTMANEMNPGLVLGSPDRNAVRIYPYNYGVNVCLPPPKGTPTWDSLMPEIDVGVNARVFFGSKDEHWKTAWHTKLPSHGRISLEVWDGVVHDCLSVDPKSGECIGNIFAYVEEQLAGEIPKQATMS